MPAVYQTFGIAIETSFEGNLHMDNEVTLQIEFSAMYREQTARKNVTHFTTIIS